MNTMERLSTIDEMIAIVEGRVEGKTWIKGDTERPEQVNGRPVLGMCLSGMVGHLTMRMPNVFIQAEHNRMVEVMTVIGQVILEQYPERGMGRFLPDHPETAVVPFNDHSDTTAADIVRVLEKTRVKIAETV
jgi:hypothetical protein